VIGPQSTLAEVALIVCSEFSKVGITAVLTGGSAATFYAPEAHQSHDLDFVITMRGATHGGPSLAALGFAQKNQFYAHPQTRFTIDFPPGPLAVGDDTITEWRTERVGSQTSAGSSRQLLLPKLVPPKWISRSSKRGADANANSRSTSCSSAASPESGVGCGLLLSARGEPGEEPDDVLLRGRVVACFGELRLEEDAAT
jgi:hypothetical protein